MQSGKPPLPGERPGNREQRDYGLLPPPAVPSVEPLIGCDEGNGDGRGAIGVVVGVAAVIGTTGAAGLRGVATFLAAFLATFFFAFAFFATGFRRDTDVFLREGAAFRVAFLTLRFAFRFLAMIVLPWYGHPQIATRWWQRALAMLPAPARRSPNRSIRPDE